MTTTSRTRGIITAVVFGAALLAGIAGCSSGQGVAYNPAAPTTQPVARVMGATVADAVPLGTTLSSTRANITVYSVETFTPNGPAAYMSKPGIAFDVEVNYTATGNTPTPGAANDPLMIGISDFDAVDTAGHVYTASWMTPREPAFPSAITTYPGEVTRGWIVIETPLSTADLTIRAQLSNGHYYWKP